MVALALFALASSPTSLDSFLPVVLSVLGVLTAGSTAVGAIYGFRAVRHRSAGQEQVNQDLIKALAAAENTNTQLRERVAAQAAHIEYADRLLRDQEERLRDQGERIHTLERQEERWTSQIAELEKMVWSTGSRPPPGNPPGPDPTSPG